MSISKIVRNQGGYLRNLLKRRVAVESVGDAFGLLFASRNRFMRRFRILDSDEDMGLSYMQVPFSDRALWFPVRQVSDVDFDIWLDLADRYHGGYVGDCVSEGDTVIDCGGYAGQFAAWALDRGAGRVVVFEPDPRSAECVRRNLSSRLASGTVVLREAAVADADGSIDLHLTPNPSANTVSMGFVDRLGIEPHKQVCVPSVSIDSSVEVLGLDRVDMIKMDIEGAEPSAVAGSAHSISRFQPSLAVCAYHMPGDREAVRKILASQCPEYSRQATLRGSALIDIWRCRA
jgi:FkbM family methyltransferase